MQGRRRASLGAVSSPSPPKRVHVVQLPPSTLAALADGDLDTANSSSPVLLTPVFVETDWQRTWRYRAIQVVDDPSSVPWVTGAILDSESGVVVGRAGFHGPPDDDGMVEVGYAVDPVYRRRGYGRAALAALLARAAGDPAVRVIRASVSPGNVASLGLIAQFGFVRVGDQWDDDDGLELVFEVPPNRPMGGPGTP
jgi:RimJ/RimL family protein N-acetyltransferase